MYQPKISLKDLRQSMKLCDNYIFIDADDIIV